MAARGFFVPGWIEGQRIRCSQEPGGGGVGLAAALAVMLSIVNCDRSSFGYYASKAAKELVYERSGLETVALRATQYHSLLATACAAGSKLRIIPVVTGARFQPIAPEDAAASLFEEALKPATGRRHGARTIGGPEIHEMGEFARQWKAAAGSQARPVRFPLPGAMGTYLRAGLNLVPQERHAGETFSGWLAKNADSL